MGKQFDLKKKFKTGRANTDTEEKIVWIARKVPIVDDQEEDDLRREIRRIRHGKEEEFCEKLSEYIDKHVEGYKLCQDKDPNIPIDQVWSPILVNEQFPLMSKLLTAVLSIFHSTASVEGAINTTRNILGDRAHNLSDVNLSSRKKVKSAVKVSESKCCFNYDDI